MKKIKEAILNFQNKTKESPFSLFRIFLGIVIILDTFQRMSLSSLLYSDQGILPRSIVITNSYDFSLFFISGSPYFSFLLFSINMIMGFLIIFRVHTLKAILISLCLVISYQNRAPTIFYGGDQVLKVLIFFSIFFPFDKKNYLLKDGNFYFFVYLIQVSFIYWGSLFFKLNSSDQWFPKGVAPKLLIQFDSIINPLFHNLKINDILSQALSFSILLMLFVTPILFFCGRKSRRMATYLLIMFHSTIFLTLKVGLFPIINIVSLLPLLKNHKVNPFQNLSFEKKSILKNSALCFSLFFIIIWNFKTFFPKKLSFFNEIFLSHKTFILEQKWNMFSFVPEKDRFGGFYLKNNDQSEKELTKTFLNSYPFWTNHLIKKHLNHAMIEKWGKVYRKPFGNYMCYKQSELGPKAEISYVVYSVKEDFPIWTFSCSKTVNRFKKNVHWQIKG